MINVGIIGSGFIVPIFIEATTLVKGFKYVGIASPVEEQLKNLKEIFRLRCTPLNKKKVFGTGVQLKDFLHPRSDENKEIIKLFYHFTSFTSEKRHVRISN